MIGLKCLDLLSLVYRNSLPPLKMLHKHTHKQTSEVDSLLQVWSYFSLSAGDTSREAESLTVVLSIVTRGTGCGDEQVK